MTPEKKYVYKVLVLLDTHLMLENRKTITMTHVKNVESKVDVELKRKTLENRMKVREKGTVDEILGCIEELADDPGVDAVDPAEEGILIENLEEEEEAAAEEEARQEELLSKRRRKKKTFNSRVANKEMHPNMTEDVWVLGKKTVEGGRACCPVCVRGCSQETKKFEKGDCEKYKRKEREYASMLCWN